MTDSLEIKELYVSLRNLRRVRRLKTNLRAAKITMAKPSKKCDSK